MFIYLCWPFLNIFWCCRSRLKFGWYFLCSDVCKHYHKSVSEIAGALEECSCACIFFFRITLNQSKFVCVCAVFIKCKARRLLLSTPFHANRLGNCKLKFRSINYDYTINILRNANNPFVIL